MYKNHVFQPLILLISALSCALFTTLFLVFKPHTKEHPLQSQLHTTRITRINSAYRSYHSEGIAHDVASIAATIDAFEEEYETYQEALKQAATEEAIQLSKLLCELENEEMRYIRSVDAILEKQAQKAARKKNLPLLKLIQILQTRAFLFDRVI